MHKHSTTDGHAALKILLCNFMCSGLEMSQRFLSQAPRSVGTALQKELSHTNILNTNSNIKAKWIISLMYIYHNKMLNESLSAE